MGAAPEPDPFREREHVEIRGSIPDPINLPDGCRFKGRCPEREEICDYVDPPLLSIRDGERSVACHPYYDEADRERFEELLREMDDVPEEAKREPHRKVAPEMEDLDETSGGVAD